MVPLVKYLAYGKSSSLLPGLFLAALSTSFLIILLSRSTPSFFKNSSKLSGLFNKELSIFNPFDFNNLLAGSFKSATALSSWSKPARPPLDIKLSANTGFLIAK